MLHLVRKIALCRSYSSHHALKLINVFMNSRIGISCHSVSPFSIPLRHTLAQLFNTVSVTSLYLPLVFVFAFFTRSAPSAYHYGTCPLLNTLYVCVFVFVFVLVFVFVTRSAPSAYHYGTCLLSCSTLFLSRLCLCICHLVSPFCSLTD